MADTAMIPSHFVRTCLGLSTRLMVLMAAGGALVLAGLVAGMVSPVPAVQLALLSSGSAALAIAGAIHLVTLRYRSRAEVIDSVLRTMLDRDQFPALLTDTGGRIRHRNAAAQTSFALSEHVADAPALARIFAAPRMSVAALAKRAISAGSAHEDRVNRDGHMRLSVTCPANGILLWRLEDLSAGANSAGESGLALPVAVLDAENRVLGCNQALTSLLGAAPATLKDLIGDLSLEAGEIHAVQTQTGSTPMRLFVEESVTGGREVYFIPPDFAGQGNPADLFDGLPVPLLKIARNGTIEVANRNARVLLGGKVEPGARLSDLVSGLGRSVSDWLEEAAAGRGLNRSEFLQVSASESDLFVQVSLRRLEERGEVRLLAVLTDATELKTLEAQFVQSQKMQAIGQLAGGVAHDFNNLLTAISGHCDLLLLRHDQGDPDYGDLVQIHQNANRAASLVGQLLAFSRKQTLQPEVVDLRDTLSDLTHLLNRLVGERVRLTLKHGAELPPIRADKRQLEQVMMNLVVNARDAMPTGGEIVIETEARTLESEFRRNRASIPPGDYVVVKVTDQGVGIPPEKLPKIFEPFYTTKKTGEGTGLGLSTAYGIIKQTGGFIFADSTRDVGTIFTLFLPAMTTAPATPAIAAPSSVAGPDPVNEGVVLLVEDEAPVRAFASRALRLQGLTVIEAENAEEALDKLTDVTLKVDVFVTDVVMPGMDGPSWVREALKTRPDTQVVFVSGYAEDALDDHQARIPNSLFLPKPFSLKDLTATVQRQLQ